MKIAYFTDFFLPAINGVVTSLINFSRELGKRDHQVLIFAPESDKQVVFKEKNVKVVSLPSIPGPVYPDWRLGRGGFIKAYKKIKDFKPDIFHFSAPLTIGLQGVILAKIFEKPLVGTFHPFLTEEEYLKFIKHKKAILPLKELFLSFQKFFYSACDVAIAPCFSLKKGLLRQGFKKPIAVVPNGVDLNFITRLSGDEILKLKKELGLKVKVVLHFGRLSAEKNIDVLLKAAKLVIKKEPDVNFLIIGGGPSFKELKSLAKKLEISKKVRFTGPIKHDQLLSSGMLNLGTVFATASKMENQSMAVLEAMASGLPIVGVNKAGLPELIKKNGFLARPDDIGDIAEKILRILKDETLRKKMSQASLKLADKYSIEKSTDKLLRLYNHLLGRKKKRRKIIDFFKRR